MYQQYVKQVRAVLRVALAKVAGKLFFSRGTLPLKAKPIATVDDAHNDKTLLSPMQQEQALQTQEPTFPEQSAFRFHSLCFRQFRDF
jgi:hypothetical protein